MYGIPSSMDPTGRRGSWVSLWIAVLLPLLFPFDGSSAGLGTSSICSRTARAAFRACRHEARDDFWITVGRCLNTAAAGERAECISAAEEARSEARAECGEQRSARLELCELLGEASYDPPFEPRDFVDPREIGSSVPPNPFFPLVPGARWVYRGGEETITVEVTGEVEEILGVDCAVVRDRVEEDGEAIEDTEDWFAQHVDGTIWYCGELSRELEDGELVSLEGSWKAGRELARPGVIMPGAPELGQAFRQEFALGDAEDVFEIVSLSGTESAPAASCHDECVVTRDFTPLEPGALELKFYARDLGLILEVNPETGERVELIDFEIPVP